MDLKTYVLILACVLLVSIIMFGIHCLRLKKFEDWVEAQFLQISKVTVNYNKNFEAIQNFFNQVNGDDVK